LTDQIGSRSGLKTLHSKVSETVDPGATDLGIYVGLEHLDAEDIHIRRKGVPADVSGGKLRCYPGDVIFGKRRAYQRKAAVVDFNGICSAHAFVLRAKPKTIDPRLFPFFLHSDAFMHRMVDISVGGLSPTINWSDLKHQEFLLPPKDQQAQLAELFWAMNEVVERESSLVERLEIQKKAICKEFFTDRGVKMKIADYGEVITGRTPSTKEESFWGASTPFVTPAEVTNSTTVSVTERFLTDAGVQQARLLPANAVLTVCIGSTIGKVAIAGTECCTNQQINAIIPHPEYPSLFLMNLIRHYKNKILARVGTTAVPLLNKTEFSLVSLPSIDESGIPLFVEKMCSTDLSLSRSMEKFQGSRRLQKSLINQVF
jgi:type I restriction enzyme S subunit